MSAIRYLVPVLLAVLVATPPISAQAPVGPANEGLPGGQYRGRYIGFQPRYGQRAGYRPQSSASRPSTSTTSAPQSATRPPRPKTNTIKTSSFEDSLAASAPLEEGELIAEPETLMAQPATACGIDACCEAEPMVWVRGDYLHWWTKGMGTPALATTSPPGTPQDAAGVLGSFNTSTLFGAGDLLDESRSGGRIIFGMWLDPCQSYGVEFSYLGLDDESASFRGTNDTFSILARPFQNVVTGEQDARLIVFPDLVEGSLAIDSSTQFQTGEVMLRRPGITTCWSRIDFFCGYRYAELEDQVGIFESTVSLAEPTIGTSFDLKDMFETRNRFNGGQVGVRMLSYTAPGWSVELLGKMALGNTNSRTAIHGQTVVTLPTGASTTQPAGLLVQGTNQGVYETNEVSSITELGLTMRRHLPCGWAMTCGYNFLFWTDVLRAGEQIDTGINVSQIPPGVLAGEPRPAFTAQTNDFWAQGLSLGLECSY